LSYVSVLNQLFDGRHVVITEGIETERKNSA